LQSVMPGILVVVTTLAATLIAHLAGLPPIWVHFGLGASIGIAGLFSLVGATALVREYRQHFSAPIFWSLICATLLVIASLGAIAYELHVLETSVSLTRYDLDRFAMPRTISDADRDAMIAYLQKYDPHPILLRLVGNNFEVDQLFGQLAGVFTQSYWKISTQQVPAESVASVGAGISIAAAQASPPLPPSVNGKPDLAHPTPAMLVKQALKIGHLTINGESASGDGAGDVTLTVGVRPLDLHQQ
jgi:hypothetical protein